MNLNPKQVAEILAEKDNIVILTHFHPDGDTLGSAVALLRALRSMGKKVNFINNDPIHPKYAYLWKGLKKQKFKEQYIVAVDIATEELLGDSLKEQYSGKIELAIDHHPSNTLFAKQTCLEGDSAAAAEIVYYVIKELGVEIDAAIASCIYTGISTDTGCFKFRNTTARTFYIAGIMKDLGADTERINEVMFETKTRGELELERLMLEGMEYYYDNKLAIAVIRQEMYRQTGTTEDECEYIASIPRQVAGVFVGVTIRERKNGMWKASVRTKPPLDASAICMNFGGGGHENAAGCNFDGTLEEFKEKLVKIVGEIPV
ncbi:MAG: bifunctional oligoribonuclease/PAP phosphatase NrnA [Clostridia bacterium]|nr:bifunctional oligoribonuclease/PAP phosphatase NrnA [Clostridia bacterium]